MSSLIPLLHELLPMILPSSISVTPASEIEDGLFIREMAIPDQAPRVVRKDAIVGCGSMSASVLVIKPRSATSIRHHGEQDTIVSAVSGTGILETKLDLEDEQTVRRELAPGSFAFIPSWTEHRIINETDEDVRWTLTYNGGTPVVVDLVDWGGDELKPGGAGGKKKKKEGWVIVRPDGVRRGSNSDETTEGSTNAPER